MADSPGGPDLERRLQRWVAEQKVQGAAADRRQKASLLAQAAEDGTFAGVLLDLSDRERPVVLDTVGGRRIRGVIRTVGVDFIGLRIEEGDGVLVRIDALAAVRPEAEAAATVGDRPVHLITGLAEVLMGLAGDRPRVLVRTTHGEAFAGTLRSAGRDVLAVRLDGPDAGTVYLGLHAVTEVTLP
ncbi:MAG TPA: hypothetical protein VGM93_07450 [Acidimicrobiales bacterium]|jgi:small nuclear ribonucleoprotein (snRNP)-like protein